MRKYLVLTLTLLVCLAESRKLPSNFPRCNRNDPDLNNCFSRAVEEVLSLLTESIPEVGLPKADPLEIESLEIPAGGANIIQAHGRIKNIKVHNILATKVEHSDLTLGDKEIKIVVNLHSPWYKGEAELQLNNQESGALNKLEVEDVYITMEVTGVLYEKRGEKHIRIKEVNVDGAPRKVKADIHISSNESLNNQINAFVNSNWKMILQELKRNRGRLESFIKSAGDTFFSRYSYDELFPQ